MRTVLRLFVGTWALTSVLAFPLASLAQTEEYELGMKSFLKGDYYTASMRFERYIKWCQTHPDEENELPSAIAHLGTCGIRLNPMNPWRNLSYAKILVNENMKQELQPYQVYCHKGVLLLIEMKWIPASREFMGAIIEAKQMPPSPEQERIVAALRLWRCICLGVYGNTVGESYSEIEDLMSTFPPDDPVHMAARYLGWLQGATRGNWERAKLYKDADDADIQFDLMRDLMAQSLEECLGGKVGEWGLFSQSYEDNLVDALLDFFEKWARAFERSYEKKLAEQQG